MSSNGAHRVVVGDTIYLGEYLDDVASVIQTHPAEDLLRVHVELLTRLSYAGHSSRDDTLRGDSSFTSSLRDLVRSNRLPYLFYEMEIDGEFVMFLEYGGEKPLLSDGYRYVIEPSHRIIWAITALAKRYREAAARMPLDVRRLPQAVVDRVAPAKVALIRHLLWLLLEREPRSNDIVFGRYTWTSPLFGTRVPILVSIRHADLFGGALELGWDAGVEVNLCARQHGDLSLQNVINELWYFDALFPDAGQLIQSYRYAVQQDVRQPEAQTMLESFFRSTSGRKIIKATNLFFAFTSAEFGVELEHHLRGRAT